MSPDFSEEELTEFAAQHLVYEVGAAANQAIAWYYSSATASRPIQSALLSATLVHLRLLADFLHKPPSRDDVAATHFLATWESHGDPLAIDREAINGHVAHLAMRREPRPLWDLLDLAAGVFMEVERFMQELDAAGSDRFVVALQPAAEMAQGFRAWALSYDDFMLESESADASGLNPEEQEWYLALPALPTRVRGS